MHSLFSRRMVLGMVWCYGGAPFSTPLPIPKYQKKFSAIFAFRVSQNLCARTVDIKIPNSRGNPIPWGKEEESRWFEMVLKDGFRWSGLADQPNLSHSTNQTDMPTTPCLSRPFEFKIISITAIVRPICQSFSTISYKVLSSFIFRSEATTTHYFVCCLGLSSFVS